MSDDSPVTYTGTTTPADDPIRLAREAINGAITKVAEQLAAHVDEQSAGDEKLRQALVNSYIIRAAVVHEDGQWKAKAWIDIRQDADGFEYLSYESGSSFLNPPDPS